MDEVPWYVHLFVAWLPFLFLVGLGIWITRWVSKSLRTNDGRSIGQAIIDQARELQRSNDLLEEALKDHRRRLETLEQKR